MHHRAKFNQSRSQISSKSVKQLQRYGDLTVFKMAAVGHLGFVKFNFFNRCGDIAIFVIFKMAAAAILDFQKFKILTVVPVPAANMRHLAKFHQDRSSSRRYMVI